MRFKKNNNKIYLEDNNKIIAEIEYEEKNNAYIITHTFVDESLRGQGIAKQLVEQVIEEAKKNNKEITATCSYAKKILNK